LALFKLMQLMIAWWPDKFLMNWPSGHFHTYFKTLILLCCQPHRWRKYIRHGALPRNGWLSYGLSVFIRIDPSPSPSIYYFNNCKLKF
jgi:hypothetical protein